MNGVQVLEAVGSTVLSTHFGPAHISSAHRSQLRNTGALRRRRRILDSTGEISEKDTNVDFKIPQKTGANSLRHKEFPPSSLLSIGTRR